ncbi:putative histidine transporter YuiF (NhaC family) [Chromobacterium alkanivorans]|uniref:Na+/H+ antiporter family protein n=1 Tax=Chromobacterium TaxID=535 RepID=UPI0006544C05|nr:MULTISPECIES: Na+/H+ antiporter NhaC family protein [Chromobacterium]KMN83274.1 sodium:proton antiporter [Chromobacterium sp. LK11]MCS3803327.1 putative histidine transporter YuiF (NhaC family) [Chromobacterium alkanivorans]MCS3817563.1 putative histidine transporter YuiF (NhaC family) [Chromobacterium alkanivorans]MCS3872693.1 putative histidine transporter YuiF (NhaC family) [Chromobacterium alkanivorans]
MNAVLLAVIVMLGLALLRTHVVISLLLGALIGGLCGGLSLSRTLEAFNNGITGGASVALSYALLGAFALAIAKSGLPHAMADLAVKRLERDSGQSRLKWALILLLAAVSVASQNLVPIHIAFIPLLVPPLLYVMARLHLDRRLVACVITFGLVTPYMVFPVGFGDIFLKQILLGNIAKSGMDVRGLNVMHAMAIPALGMVAGLLWAVLVSYRKPRQYALGKIENAERTRAKVSRKSLATALLAIALAFAVQLYTDSMIMGALAGFLLFLATGVVKWKDADGLFNEGMKMMAMIGFTMITAQGFAEVLKATGQVGALVTASAGLFAGNQGVAAFAMLLVGLVVTLGIGSSFSTVPILTAIYVPLCMHLGFSPLATVAIIGTAGALGDAGSPASDSTLGPTSGLNVDGQHDHIRDTVLPTFLHYNLPVLAAGWIAAMVL